MPHVQTKKMFMVNRKTMERHCMNGFKKSTRKSKDKSLRKKFSRHTLYRPDDLPPKVDLRPWMTPVENQSDLNSCTANAVAGLYEYLIKKSTNKHVDVSRLFVYYNARKKDLENDKSQAIISDEGATVTSAIETLKELGICLESIWPYKKKLVNLKPSPMSYRGAKESTIIEAMSVPVDLYQMKSCLAQGFPFLFGLELYASFDKASFNGGVVPVPKASAAARASHGNHAMLAVGYSEASQAFIVRNSWGKKWGDKGYCYIPYAYMTDKNFCSDLWTVKQIPGDSLGTEQWVMRDIINYLAPSDVLGPEAYTDDSVGVIIEESVVRERIYPTSYPEDYGGDYGGGHGGGHGGDHGGDHGRDDDGDDGGDDGGRRGGRHARDDDGDDGGDDGGAQGGEYGGAQGGDYGGAQGGDYGGAQSGDYGGAYGGVQGGDYGGAQSGDYGGAYGGVQGGDYGGAYGGAQGGEYGGAYGGGYGGDYGGAQGGAYGGGYGGDYGGAQGGGYGADYGGAYGGSYGGDYGGAQGGSYGGGYE